MLQTGELVQVRKLLGVGSGNLYNGYVYICKKNKIYFKYLIKIHLWGKTLLLLLMIRLLLSLTIYSLYLWALGSCASLKSFLNCRIGSEPSCYSTEPKR